MHRWRTWPAAVLVLVLMAWPALAQAAVVGAPGAGDWWTRGRDAGRQHRTAEGLGPVGAFEAWRVELGLSASQPLYVGGRIYHMAGNSLWEVTPRGGGPPGVRELARGINGPEGSWRPSSSSLTYAELPDGRRVLYFGTGDNRLCAYRLDTGGWLCRQLGGAEPVVASPLVFAVRLPGGRAADLVVMGDKAGGLWAVQDLAGSEPEEVQTSRLPVGGAWLTASPTAVGDLEFLIAADGVGEAGGNGKLARIRVVPDMGSGRGPALQKVWEKTMPHGIADGFAADRGDAFFADVRGNLYSVDARTGDLNVVPAPGPRFANSMPAAGDRFVYFSIRNVGTTLPSREAPGEVVAVDRQTWTVAWRAQLPAPANTDPLLWPDQGVVLVGDVRGSIHGFDMETGVRAAFAREPGDLVGGMSQCLPVASLNLLEPGEEPYRAEHAYQQLSGAGTDITLASGTTGEPLLLVGANVTRAGGTHSGRLVAYAAGSRYNVRWLTRPEEVAPGAPVEPGQTVGFTAELTVDGEARPVTARWYFRGPDGGLRLAGAGAAQVHPGQAAPVPVALQVRQEDAPGGELIGIANPEELVWLPGPEGELAREALAAELEAAGLTQEAQWVREFTDLAAAGELDLELLAVLAGLGIPGRCAQQMPETEWTGAAGAPALADNILVVPVAVQEAAIDLELRDLTAPERVQFEGGTRYTVRFTLVNHGQREVRTAYQLQVSSNHGGYETAAIPVTLNPGEARVIEMPVSVTTNEGRQTVRVTVNPDRSVRETNYDNNTGMAFTDIQDRPLPQGGSIYWGRPRSVVVPEDCVTNPDPTSPIPCINYPDRRID